ncbi:MAG TPA: pilus assembly protein TadG-related protein, partial [Candidatus Eisenbacteria bacterium]|nr:pilus assembly protein TadG-related protein [Candidatus Eisenbacteria bacterium]
MKRSNETHRADERGVAILYVAVFMLVSLWFVSLAIDVGKVMAARTELQAAADAAALAGASAIDPDTGEIVPDSARVRAAVTAFQNKAYQGVQTAISIN